MARLRVAHASGIELRTTGVVVAQVWRDRTDRQANLGRLLRSVDVRAVDAPRVEILGPWIVPLGF